MIGSRIADLGSGSAAGLGSGGLAFGSAMIFNSPFWNVDAPALEKGG
jgi:hypothetical protein